MKHYYTLSNLSALKLKSLKLKPRHFLLTLLLVSVCVWIIPTAAQVKGRTLLIISELDERGVKELAPLYKTLEKLTWSLPSQVSSLDNIYLQQKLLTGARATIAGSQEFLVQMLRDPNVNQIDLILGVHGLPDSLAFSDGSIGVNQWVAELKDKLVSSSDDGLLINKLGLLYNLSCYGASHIHSFLDLGFKAVVGSRSVNANAELEYPWVLQMLASGASVKEAFHQPNSDGWLKVADEPVRWLGRKQNSFLKETDSYKVIGGNENFTLFY